MPEDPIGGAVRNLFDLRELENDISVEAHRLLLDLFDDIAAQINDLDPTDLDSPTLREERLAALVDEIEGLTGETFGELEEMIAERGTDVGLQQAEWAADQLRQVIGIEKLAQIDVDITAEAVTRQQIRSIVTEEPFRGAILSDWADRQAENTVFQVSRQIQLGMAQNETTGDIIRRVRGRQAGFLRFDPETGDFVEQGTPGARVRPRFQGGVLSTTTHQAEALVRTAINHTANRAHTATFQANQDVTETWTYTAVLDSRTSQICMGLDGQVFDHGEGPIPPNHFNCRSVQTPNIKWDELGVEAPEPGTRQATGGQVSAQQTYEDWLDNQEEALQNEILGPGRAKLFREGKIDLRELVTKDHRRRTLDELRQRAD